MLGEYLLGQVREERGVRLVDAGEHVAPCIGRRGLQRLDREADRGRPPTGKAVNLRGEVVGIDAKPLDDQLRHLPHRECELAAVDLEELTLSPKTLDLEWRLPSPGDDQVETGWRVPAQGFDKPGRGARWLQLVSVIDDQEEIGGELRVQDLRQLGGERVGA